MINLILSILMVFACSTQKKAKRFECTECNIATITTTDKEIETVKVGQVITFLCTIKKECSKNVEFSEYSNEVLFKLIDRRTQTFIDAFANVPESDRINLLDVIANPLLDYNTAELKIKIEKSEASDGIKKSLIAALGKSEK